MIQLCSAITRGRVLNGELYAQRCQKLIYLHLFTDCFMKISFWALEQTQCSDDSGEICMKQYGNINADELSSEICVYFYI